MKKYIMRRLDTCGYVSWSKSAKLDDAGLQLLISNQITPDISVYISEEIRKMKILGSKSDIELNEQSLEILELITSRRDSGMTQADIAKEIKMDPRSVYHYLKGLSKHGFIVKYPITQNGTTTNICFSFLFLNSCFLGSKVQYIDKTDPKAYKSFILAFLSGLESKSVSLDELRQSLGLNDKSSMKCRIRKLRAVLNDLQKSGYVDLDKNDEGTKITLLKEDIVVDEDQKYCSSESEFDSENEENTACISIAEMSIESQILRIIKNSGAKGVTLNFIRRSMGFLSPKTLNCIMDNLASKKTDKCRKVLENRGKTNRYRYLAHEFFHLYDAEAENRTDEMISDDEIKVETVPHVTASSRRMKIMEILRESSIVEFNVNFREKIQNMIGSNCPVERRTILRDFKVLENEKMAKTINISGSTGSITFLALYDVNEDNPKFKQVMEEIKWRSVFGKSIVSKNEMAVINSGTTQNDEIPSLISVDETSARSSIQPLTPYTSPRKAPFKEFNQITMFKNEDHEFITKKSARAKLLHKYILSRLFVKAADGRNGFYKNSGVFSALSVLFEDMPFGIYSQLIGIPSDNDILREFMSMEGHREVALKDLDARVRSIIEDLDKFRKKMKDLLSILLELGVLQPLSSHSVSDQVLLKYRLVKNISIRDYRTTNFQILEFHFIDSLHSLKKYWSRLKFLCLKNSDVECALDDKNPLSNICKESFWLRDKKLTVEQKKLLASFRKNGEESNPHYNEQLCQHISSLADIPVPEIKKYYSKIQKKAKINPSLPPKKLSSLRATGREKAVNADSGFSLQSRNEKIKSSAGSTKIEEWTESEICMLIYGRAIMSSSGRGCDWKLVSNLFKDKSPVDCSDKYMSLCLTSKYRSICENITEIWNRYKKTMSSFSENQDIDSLKKTISQFKARYSIRFIQDYVKNSIVDLPVESKNLRNLSISVIQTPSSIQELQSKLSISQKLNHLYEIPFVNQVSTVQYNLKFESVKSVVRGILLTDHEGYDSMKALESLSLHEEILVKQAVKELCEQNLITRVKSSTDNNTPTRGFQVSENFYSVLNTSSFVDLSKNIVDLWNSFDSVTEVFSIIFRLCSGLLSVNVGNNQSNTDLMDVYGFHPTFTQIPSPRKRKIINSNPKSEEIISFIKSQQSPASLEDLKRHFKLDICEIKTVLAEISHSGDSKVENMFDGRFKYRNKTNGEYGDENRSILIDSEDKPLKSWNTSGSRDLKIYELAFNAVLNTLWKFPGVNNYNIVEKLGGFFNILEIDEILDELISSEQVILTESMPYLKKSGEHSAYSVNYYINTVSFLGKL